MHCLINLFELLYISFAFVVKVKTLSTQNTLALYEPPNFRINSVWTETFITEVNPRDKIGFMFIFTDLFCEKKYRIWLQ